MFMHVDGQPLAQYAQRPGLEAARALRHVQRVDGVVAYQIGNDQLGRAVQDQEVLAQRFKFPGQRGQALGHEALALRA